MNKLKVVYKQGEEFPWLIVDTETGKVLGRATTEATARAWAGGFERGA